MTERPKAEQPKSPIIRLLPIFGAVIVVAAVIALIFSKLVVPQFEKAEERQSRPVEADVMGGNFSSEFVRKFEDHVHIYRRNYLSDGVAYERLPGGKPGSIPDGLTPEEALNFMKDRVYSLDLHFETVWDPQQRMSGRLPSEVPVQQRSFRKTFVGDVAFFMEAYAKAHDLDLSYTSEPTHRQRSVAVNQLKQIMADEPDRSYEGKTVQTILDGMRAAAGGLLACDTVDLQTGAILQDLNYFIQWALPVEEPYDFSEIIRNLLRNRTRTARLNRKVIKNMASYCQSAAPDSWVSTELIFPVIDAYLRAVQISLSEQLPKGMEPTMDPELDDYDFSRRMESRVYLRDAWRLLIRKTVGDYAAHPVVQRDLAELPDRIKKEFEVEVPVPASSDAETVIQWVVSTRNAIATQRASKFKKTVEAFPSSAKLADTAYTPGTPARDIIDRMKVLELVAAMELGAPERAEASLNALRQAHQYLVDRNK